MKPYYSLSHFRLDELTFHYTHSISKNQISRIYSISVPYRYLQIFISRFKDKNVTLWISSIKQCNSVNTLSAYYTLYDITPGPLGA